MFNSKFYYRGNICIKFNVLVESKLNVVCTLISTDITLETNRAFDFKSIAN